MPPTFQAQNLNARCRVNLNLEAGRNGGNIEMRNTMSLLGDRKRDVTTNLLVVEGLGGDEVASRGSGEGGEVRLSYAEDADEGLER